MIMKLYFNDPPGGRWTHINSVVAELNRKYDFEIRVVKKTDFKFMEKFSLPKFPALEIDSKLIFEGRDTTIEEMEEVIRSIQKDYVGL